jgi:hypothetical protein
VTAAAVMGCGKAVAGGLDVGDTFSGADIKGAEKPYRSHCLSSSYAQHRLCVQLFDAFMFCNLQFKQRVHKCVQLHGLDVTC